MDSRYKLTYFSANLFSTNTYIFSDSQRKTAIIFDAPGKVDEILKYLESNGIERVEAVFITHGHVDHILAVNELRAKLPGNWKTYLGEADLKLWRGFNQQMADFGLPLNLPSIADPEVLLKGGEEFTIGDYAIQCILSPGHSEGSIVYSLKRGEDHFLITGDVLFLYSVGRTDWTGIPILEGTSSHAELSKSVRRLANFPLDTKILPGHGEVGELGKALRRVSHMLFFTVFLQTISYAHK